MVDEADTFLDAGLKNKIDKYMAIIKNLNSKQENQCKTVFVGATFTGPLNNFFKEHFGSTAE